MTARNVTAEALVIVQRQWALAAAVHELNNTKPDQPAADPDDERVQELYRVACTCGC